MANQRKNLNDTPVRFLVKYQKWNKGENAGFPKKDAKILIDSGIAEYVSKATVFSKRQKLEDIVVEK